MLVIKINFATGDLPIHWNRYPREIEFISFVSKKCHNKNRFRTAAAAPALASVANMTLLQKRMFCGIWLVCRLPRICYFLVGIDVSLGVCFFSIVSVLFFFISPKFCFVSSIFSQCNRYFASLLRRFDQHFEYHISGNAIDNHHILRSLFLYHPTNAKSRNIWIKCANFCTCPFRNSEMIDSSVR